MSIKRFNEIPSQFVKAELVVYDPIAQRPVGERIVDDSYYVPNKEANKILSRQAAAQVLNDLLYDDPADIAAGTVNVYARQRGRDLAELTQQMRTLQSKAQQEINEAIENKKKQDAAVSESNSEQQQQTLQQQASQQ